MAQNLAGGGPAGSAARQAQVLSLLAGQAPQGASPIQPQSAEQALATQLPDTRSMAELQPATAPEQLPAEGGQEMWRRATGGGDPIDAIIAQLSGAKGSPWSDQFAQPAHYENGDGNFQSLPVGNDPSWQQFVKQEGGMTFAQNGQPGNMQLDPRYGNIREAFLGAQGAGLPESTSPAQAALRSILNEYLSNRGEVLTGSPADPHDNPSLPWNPRMWQTGRN